MKKMDELLIKDIEKSKKICLFGCPGSGKSTLAKKLSSFLKLNVYHLDNVYWLPNWNKLSKDEFDNELMELLKKR